jgi:hypothetical protein
VLWKKIIGVQVGSWFVGAVQSSDLRAGTPEGEQR